MLEYKEGVDLNVFNRQSYSRNFE